MISLKQMAQVAFQLDLSRIWNTHNVFLMKYISNANHVFHDTDGGLFEQYNKALPSENPTTRQNSIAPTK